MYTYLLKFLRELPNGLKLYVIEFIRQKKG